MLSHLLISPPVNLAQVLARFTVGADSLRSAVVLRVMAGSTQRTKPDKSIHRSPELPDFVAMESLAIAADLALVLCLFEY